MKEIRPLVSVLMTAYNRELFIAEAIESVLESSYQNFELIILDDGSKDKTVEIARRYAQDERVKVYVNEVNLGQFPNRNRIVDYATGEFIMYADSDDKVLHNGIENLVNAMNSFPSAHFAMYSPESKTPNLVEPETAIQDHFFKKAFLTHGPGGTFLRRSFFLGIGKYPTDYGIPGDMYFNLKAASQSPVLLIPFQFMYYRRHDGQEINNEYDYLYNNYKYMRDALKLLPLPITVKQKRFLTKKMKRRFVVNILKFYRQTRNLAKTRHAIKMANFNSMDAIEGIFHF